MKKIFLIEDDLTIAKNLILLLRAEGFTVTHAPTRREALAALAGSRFDLALIDISLPDGNGFTVCTEIKESQDIRHLSDRLRRRSQCRHRTEYGRG